MAKVTTILWPSHAAHAHGAEEARVEEVASGARCGGCDKVFSDKRVRVWTAAEVLCRSCARRLDGGGRGK